MKMFPEYLNQGSKGPAVVVLQLLLLALDLNEEIVPDGDYGEQTAKAVVRFQSQCSMEEDGKVLCGYRNYTKDVYKDISVWTLPGGRSQVGETVEQALRREILEEVGITEFEIVDFIGELPGMKANTTMLVFHTTTNQEAKLMEPNKFSEWQWVPIKDYIAEEKYGHLNPAVQKMIIDYLVKI